MNQNRFLLSACLSLAASSTVTGQGLVYTLQNTPSGNSDFGRAVSDAGDVNGDGVSDIIVGAPFHAPGGTPGAVFVYSGKTGELLWTRSGEFPGDAYGWSVDGIGDLNSDGLSDVIVGAPLYDANGVIDSGSGKIYVLSGSTGFFMFAVGTNELNARLGHAVRGLDDINGDGIGDFAFSAPYCDSNGLTDNGVFYVYSGLGQIGLYSRTGDNDGDLLGYAIDVVRASNSLASSRLIVGAPGHDGGGTDFGLARLYDGLGNVIGSIPGQSNQEWFGQSVAGIGDANGDGTADYAIAAPYADILFVGADAGSVRVYSGANPGQTLFNINGATASASLGQSLGGIGDFDGDGRPDIVAGAPNDDVGAVDVGEVRVVSGATGGTLASWRGGLNDHMGRSVGGAGDLNADGLADVLSGANEAPFGAGQAYVHLAGVTSSDVYCTPKINSQGCSPSITVDGIASLSIGDNCFVRATQVINQKFGILFWGTAQNNAPFLGGTLCAQPPLRRTTPRNSGGNVGPDDCSGSYEFHFSQSYMNTEGIAPGTRVHAQFWSRDPVASFQVGLSNAVAFDVVL